MLVSLVVLYSISSELPVITVCCAQVCIGADACSPPCRVHVSMLFFVLLFLFRASLARHDDGTFVHTSLAAEEWQFQRTMLSLGSGYSD